jgi:hypothetical protein
MDRVLVEYALYGFLKSWDKLRYICFSVLSHHDTKVHYRCCFVLSWCLSAFVAIYLPGYHHRVQV